MNHIQLILILEKLKLIHSQMPEKAQQQNRLKCNLRCSIVYLEDEITLLKEATI